jgi:hypothetical protein
LNTPSEEAAIMAEYHEDGCVMDVTILEDRSDQEWESYLLRINSVLRSSNHYHSLETGGIFFAKKKRGVVYCGIWQLLDKDSIAVRD